MKNSFILNIIKGLATLSILMILSVLWVTVTYGAPTHGTAENFISIQDVNNTVPESYSINSETQGIARDGKYNQYFLKEDIQDVYIEIDETNLNYLLQSAKREPCVLAEKVKIGDTTVQYCGMKTKGDYTLQASYDNNPGSDRFSFTINFGKFVNKKSHGEKQTFYGCEKVSFNNFFFDKTMLKEFASYKLLEEMGLPVPQYGLANLYVNDQYYGVYFMVEALDEPILEQYYQVKDVDGYLDKPKDTHLLYQEVVDNPAVLCGNDFRELADMEEDLPVVQEWVRKLNCLSSGTDFDGNTIDVNSEEYLELLGQILNVDASVRYFATHSWLCQLDSMFVWLKNYGLFVNEEGVATIIPWDYDLSFGCYGYASDSEKIANYPLDMLYPYNEGAAKGETPQDVYEQFPLFYVIYQNDALKQQFYQYMGECSQIASLGGMVSSTEKSYSPNYLISCIKKLEDDLMDAAARELPDNIYYMNYIKQPEELPAGIANLKRIIGLRAVGVYLQLSNSQSKVSGEGCDLSKLGNGVGCEYSDSGLLTVVDENTGIFIIGEFEDNGMPINFKAWNIDENTFQLWAEKEPKGQCSVTIPLAPELAAKKNLVLYQYNDGVPEKVDMQVTGNLCTGYVEALGTFVLTYEDEQQEQKETNILVVMVVFVVIFAGIILGLYWSRVHKCKKHTVIMIILMAVTMIAFLVFAKTLNRSGGSSQSQEESPVVLSEKETKVSEYETELLGGRGWWQSQTYSNNYFLNGNGEMIIDVHVSEKTQAEDAGFCIELFDKSDHYLTTASEGNAWFAGTQGTISGIKQGVKVTPGSWIRVYVIREDNKYTVKYTLRDSGEELLKIEAADHGTMDEIMKVRMIAQVGMYRLQVKEIKESE